MTFSSIAQQHRRHACALVLGGRDEHRSTLGGQLSGECFAVEALVCQQVTRDWPGFQQV